MRCIDDYRSLFVRFPELMAKRIELHSDPPLAEILASQPRLVWVVSHSTPLSWIPLPFIVGREVARCGGGSRRPLGVFHRFLHRVPVLRRAIGFLSQGSRAWGAAEITEALSGGTYTDLVVFPEGHNSFFGKNAELRPFVSSRYVEIAVRSQTPLLVVSHLGTEGWSRHVRGRALLPLLRRVSPKLHGVAVEAGGFCIPTLPRRMPAYKVACRLHTPALRTSDLSEDRAERHRQLAKESTAVRAIMQELLEELQSAGPHAEPRTLGLRDDAAA